MTTFVFDECFNDKRVIKNCNDQGLCNAQRYPKHLISTKDYDMLPVLLSGTDPLVTIDYDILDEHSAHVPANNAGAIIVKYITIKKLMTTKDAAIMLSSFKTKYGSWNAKNWANIRLEITEAGVFISKTFNPGSGPVYFIDYSEKDFEAKVDSALESVSISAQQDAQQPLPLTN